MIETKRVRTVTSDLTGRTIENGDHARVKIATENRSWVMDANIQELEELGILGNARETTGTGRGASNGNSNN